MTGEIYVYVVTAYDEEKDRLGEIIVLTNLSQAEKLVAKLKGTYKSRHVTLASRLVDSIPFNLLIGD